MSRKYLGTALLIVVFSLLLSGVASADPYVSHSKHSGLQKSWMVEPVGAQWQFFGEISPYALDGKRALFFAQAHLYCTKKPRYVKIRLARIHPDGSLDTTGTNTWVMGKNSPTKWQGSLWWESKTKYPILAQYRVKGGSCVSTQRQFKWWQPDTPKK